MLGREAAELVTKSREVNLRLDVFFFGSKYSSGGYDRRLREVDLSRLKGFHLRFAPKMRISVICNWCLRFVCVSPASIERANFFTLY